MRDLFRSFEAERVRYLLIGGQAAVLYGAAHFTSDIDIWLEPRPPNVTAFLRALELVEARVHKLTPPLDAKWIRAGHGFHFVIPTDADGLVYLDAMGFPPRATSFLRAERRAKRLSTPWGELPVAGIQDLVELKKTNRPGDYEVISRLARIRLAEVERPRAQLLRWALENSFRVEDVRAIAATYPSLALPHRGDEAVARSINQRLLKLLDAGRRYWTPRIRELKQLRATGGLLKEGTPVADLR